MDSRITRRGMLRGVGLTAGAVAVLGAQAVAQEPPNQAPTGRPPTGPVTRGAQRDGRYILPPLPYAPSALQPYLGEQTLKTHHDRHHAAYVDGFNRSLDLTTQAGRDGRPELMNHWAQLAAFNGSGHLLHTLYWENMVPNGGGRPDGPAGQAIQRDFTSHEAFVAAFAGTAKNIRGNGWGLLAWEPVGRRLIICGIEHHQNQILIGAQPLLVMDVWEHAYYLDYQNDRGRYVDAFMNHLVNWDVVSRRLTALQG